MKNFLKDMFSLGVYLLVVFGLVWLVITFVGQRTVVDGQSMESTLQDGDSLWVDKLSYRFKDPERFDIVVFPFDKATEKTYFIKRIIGLPGETVQIDLSGNIYINGEELEENYGREIIDVQHVGVAEQPITLGENEYFVMGDNRNNSTDSRFEVVGNIDREILLGKAVFRLYPFSKFGKVR